MAVLAGGMNTGEAHPAFRLGPLPGRLGRAEIAFRRDAVADLREIRARLICDAPSQGPIQVP